MLSRLFQRPHHVRRLRANPLGDILDQFADYLLQRGYTPASSTSSCARRSITATGWAHGIPS